MSPGIGALSGPSIPELIAFREKIRGKMSWFWYGTQNLQFVGPTAPQQEPQIQIDAQADFVALNLMAFNDRQAIVISGAALGDFFTIEIADSSSSRAYQSVPMHQQLVCGTAQLPHWFAVPILFRASSSLALRVIVLNTAAVTHNIRVALGGVKFYKE